MDRLNAEAVKAMTSPDMRDRLAVLGGDPAALSPQQRAVVCAWEAERAWEGDREWGAGR